jgi:hypothetical protein
MNAGGALRVTFDDVIHGMYEPAVANWPALDGEVAQIMILAIGMQESGFATRQQVGGPARSFWQFEKGGGVHGVVRHKATVEKCQTLCAAQHVAFDEDAIFDAMLQDDVLGAGMARLLLFTDPYSLSSLTDAEAGWQCYARIWRPGRPRRETWDKHWNAARAYVLSATPHDNWGNDSRPQTPAPL